MSACTLVRYANADVGWIAEPTSAKDLVFQHLDLDVDANTIYCVTGAVGSGKSSLLLSLLKECRLQRGVHFNPLSTHMMDVSYVSQTAWIRNASVRDNILFFREYDEDKYVRTLARSELYRDISENFDHGDATPIGERGVTLSGGQKMRIALARALYDFDDATDLLLLDDVFAALDPDTALKIAVHLATAFVEKVHGRNERLTIVATTNLPFLQDVIEVVN